MIVEEIGVLDDDDEPRLSGQRTDGSPGNSMDRHRIQRHVNVGIGQQRPQDTVRSLCLKLAAGQSHGSDVGAETLEHGGDEGGFADARWADDERSEQARFAERAENAFDLLFASRESGAGARQWWHGICR
ncbi:hypothetical protein GCM10009637_11170 [Brevibacterium luteolum]